VSCEDELHATPNVADEFCDINPTFIAVAAPKKLLQSVQVNAPTEPRQTADPKSRSPSEPIANHQK